MPDLFPILEVTRAMRRDVEQLGSKPKFWFRYQDQDWLFKEARQKTGEDWAEKLGSEIATLMGLPTHLAELAVYEGKHGCAVQSFLNHGKKGLVHGNELLGGIITGYDKAKQRGQSDHTFDNIVAVLEKVFPEGTSRRAAASRMVGYLVFDALIGNTDRHHENWGVILEMRENVEGERVAYVQLAPTFDHASSMGRELTDAARQRRLDENTVEDYIRRGRGAVFADASARHGMSPIQLAQMLAQKYPDFFRPWQMRVANLARSQFEELVCRIPAERMSENARAFVLVFLETSRRLIACL